MMKHTFEQRVFYSDTDAYGIVWHGSYLRWFEMGRVGLCEMMGHNLCDLLAQDIVLPVISLNMKFKKSAKLNDEMIIETEISEFKGYSVIFKQTIKSKKTYETLVLADVEVVALNNAGKLYRKMPDVLAQSFKQELECPVLV